MILLDFVPNTFQVKRWTDVFVPVASVARSLVNEGLVRQDTLNCEE